MEIVPPMTKQLDMFTPPDLVAERNKMLVERAKQFTVDQRVRAIKAIGFNTDTGDLGTILHVESIGGFAVRFDNSEEHVQWTSVDADEIEPAHE